MFIMGAWIRVMLLVKWGRGCFNPPAHHIGHFVKILNECSTLIYVIHWLFIDMSIAWIGIPVGITNSFVWSFLVVILSVAMGCSISSAILVRIPSFGKLLGLNHAHVPEYNAPEEIGEDEDEKEEAWLQISVDSTLAIRE
jgi:hypothetical protein